MLVNSRYFVSRDPGMPQVTYLIGGRSGPVDGQAAASAFTVDTANLLGKLGDAEVAISAFLATARVTTPGRCCFQPLCCRRYRLLTGHQTPPSGSARSTRADHRYVCDGLIELVPGANCWAMRRWLMSQSHAS